jgi:hypothetical protein
MFTMRPEKNKSLENNTLVEVFEENVRQVIKKSESFLPFYIKWFSDMHREYNKYIEQTFAILKIIEERHSSKTGREMMKMCEEYVNWSFKSYLSQIDASKHAMRRDLEMRLFFMKSWNDYLKRISEDYKKQTEPRAERIHE